MSDLPRSICGWCGRPSYSDDRTCLNCRGIEMHHNRPSPDSVALTDGAWVNDRGIQRWYPALESVPEMSAFDPDEIACSHCLATITEGCRAKNGGPQMPHVGRLPRRCKCGGELLPKRTRCVDCSRATELASKRAYGLRWSAIRAEKRRQQQEVS